MLSHVIPGALAAALLCGVAEAGIVDVGRFSNLGNGQINYQGAFGSFITSEEQGDNGQYTVIHIDIAGLLDSIGERALISVTTIDNGDNAYNDAPGADIDLFDFIGTSSSPTFIYDGPTDVHQNETAQQLLQRVEALDWGTGNGRLSSMTFVSLGRDGRLTAQFDSPIFVRGGGGGLLPLVLDLSEAGTVERFRVEIETVAVPGPASGVLLMAGLVAGRVRRRRR